MKCRAYTEPQLALYDLMSEISERCYCAGWMEGTEAACWEAVLDGFTRWGISVITPEEADRLADLSNQAGGWWQWNEELMREEFLSIADWEEVYERRWKR